MIRNGGTRNEIPEEPEIGESGISNLGGWKSAIPHDTAMNVQAIEKVHLNQDNGTEAEAPQSLTILEYLVLDRAGRVL